MKTIKHPKRTFFLTRDLREYDPTTGEDLDNMYESWCLWKDNKPIIDKFGNFNGEYDEDFDIDCPTIIELLEAFGIRNTPGSQIKITVEVTCPATELDEAQRIVNKGTPKQKIELLKKLIKRFEGGLDEFLI